jgi:ABC-type phosphate transport system permease subunit
VPTSASVVRIAAVEAVVCVLVLALGRACAETLLVVAFVTAKASGENVYSCSVKCSLFFHFTQSRFFTAVFLT